jgi:hypothetical protein
MERMKKRQEELEAEIRNLIAALKTGAQSPAVMAEITRCEAEISDISDRLPSSKSQSVHSRIKELRASALGKIRDLRKC